MAKRDPSLHSLYQLFAAVDTPREAEMLLQDLLTPEEVASISGRWQLIRMLDEGVPQREIAEEIGLSISKITRGSRMLQFGSGGFLYFLKKLRKKSR
ncbi:transcriptional regulator [Candidatus Peribacteria bacterium]|nr:transcriptional regulator [Candidatus Peribacteria bacterium]